MSDENASNRDDRVKAAEPAANQRTPDRPSSPSDEPAATSARADEIDESTAGDGVAFFEGGDGREEARGDIERNG